MTNLHYIFQVILCLLIIVITPLSLTKKKLSRQIRMILALCLTLYGVGFYLFTEEVGGIVAALIGLWALFFITIHPTHTNNQEEEQK